MTAKAAELQLPKHLSSNRATGVHEGEPVAQFEIGNLSNFIYLIIDWASGAAWAIDPQTDLEPILNALSKYSLTLQGVLLTHSHHDHIAGVPAILEKFSDIQVWVHPFDIHRLKNKIKDPAKIHQLKDGEKIPCGSHSLTAHHTPGHSAGETSFHLIADKRSYLFTGDTLFIRDCGRTDFEDSSNEEMFQSLQFFKTFSDNTIVLPGHHYQPETASTIGREKLDNPPLKCKSVDELKALP